MFAGKKSAQIREILISESAWDEMTCLFAPSLGVRFFASGAFGPARRSPNRSTDFSDEAVGLPNSVDFVVVQATRSNGITDDKRRAERIVDVLWEYDRSTS